MAQKSGFWLEFGVYRGESINVIGEIAPAEVYGFDSFEGLPEDWVPGKRAGAFSLHGSLPSVTENVKLVKGWFEESLGPFLKGHPRELVSIIHLDCDLYRSAKTVLSAIAPRMQLGSIIVMDEFEGAYPDTEGRAFREFVRDLDADFDYIGASVYGSVAVRLREIGKLVASDTSTS